MFGQWDDKNERAVAAEARKRQRAKKKGCGPVAVLLIFSPWAIFGAILLLAKLT